MLAGRYAPSPTGRLHLGNLRTALLSWLQMRLLGGQFYVRMEDLDTPRVVSGSADQILRDLEWLGLDWDGDVIYQSQRTDRYKEAIAEFQNKNLLYPCYCSRKDIQQAVSAPHGVTPVYPGICRDLSSSEQLKRQQQKQPSLRVRVKGMNITYQDYCAGAQCQIESECGDFVVKRADGLFSYQLAVVVDDIAQGITHIMRGDDLLDSTAKQIWLGRQLTNNDFDIQYSHVPLMLDANGKRMAKRDGSDSILEWQQRDSITPEALVAHLASSLGLFSEKACTTKELFESLDYNYFINTLVSS